MLTDKDIDRMMQVFPTKEDVRRIVQEQLIPIQETQQRMLLALDHLASTVDKLLLEYAAVSEQLSRHERWIRELAKHSKIKLAD